jgi:hypothetical protein
MLYIELGTILKSCSHQQTPIKVNCYLFYLINYFYIWMGLLDDALSGQTLTFLFVESHKILKDGKKKKIALITSHKAFNFSL